MVNTLDNTDTETISAFRFRLYWLFNCLCFTRGGWLRLMAMQFPAKITSSCIWVAIPVEWVTLHWYACGADGRFFGFVSLNNTKSFFCWRKGESWLPFSWWNWDHRLLDVIQHCGTRYTEYPFLNSAKILFNLFLTLWNIDYMIKECETVSYNEKTRQ